MSAPDGERNFSIDNIERVTQAPSVSLGELPTKVSEALAVLGA